MLEDTIQTLSDYLFWFSIRGYVMDQGSTDGRFIGWMKILTINWWKEFSKFWRELHLLGIRSSNILTSRRRSVLRCRKSRKRTGFYEEDRAPSWSTTNDTVLNYADLFSVTLRDDIVQEFDTRWDEVLQCMSQIPSDDILESLYTLRIRESAHVKDTVWWCSGKSVQVEGAWVGSSQNSIRFVQHGDSSEDIDAQLSKKLKTMVKRSIVQKLRLRNFDARPGKMETGAVVKSHRRLCGPPIPIFEHKLVAEAHRYNCWEIPLDVLASEVQTLLNWANESLFPSRSDFPTFAESANQRTEWTLLSKRFPDSLLRSLSENVFWHDSLWHENIASSFPETPSSRDELAIKLSRLEW